MAAPHPKEIGQKYPSCSLTCPGPCVCRTPYSLSCCLTPFILDHHTSALRQPEPLTESTITDGVKWWHSFGWHSLIAFGWQSWHFDSLERLLSTTCMPDTIPGAHLHPPVSTPALGIPPLEQSALAKSRCSNNCKELWLELQGFLLMHATHPSSALCHHHPTPGARLIK